MPTFKHDAEIRAILAATLHDVPDDPEPLTSSRSLARGTTIIGLMLEQLGDKYMRMKRPGGILLRVGQAAWGLVELAAPRSLGQILFQYWIVIGYALALMMLLIGLFTNSQPVMRAGYVVLALCVVVNIVVEKLRRWMTTSDIRDVKILWLVIPLALSLLGCVIVGEKIQGIEEQVNQNGAPPVKAGQRAGDLIRHPTLGEALGRSKTEENRRLMMASLGWDSLFIVCYTVAFLSVGWLIATHFDRPFRAFALVAAATAATVGFDIAENLQAYLVLRDIRGFSPVYTSDFKLWAAYVTTGILLAEGVTAWLDARSTNRIALPARTI
jgi:hypothetical protein